MARYFKSHDPKRESDPGLFCLALRPLGTYVSLLFSAKAITLLVFPYVSSRTSTPSRPTLL